MRARAHTHNTHMHARAQVAVENRKRPTIIALSRQNMPNLPGTTREGVEKGAYVCRDCQGTPDLIIMGTGSELELAYGAADVSVFPTA